MKLSDVDIKKFATPEEAEMLKEYNDFAPREVIDIISRYGAKTILRGLYEFAKIRSDDAKKFRNEYFRKLMDIASSAHSAVGALDDENLKSLGFIKF
jgi:hypothetical protein